MVTEVQSEEFIKKDDVLGNCKSYHIEKSKCNFPDCETQINNFCNEQMELIRTKDIPGIKKSQRKFKKKLKKMNLDHYFIEEFNVFKAISKGFDKHVAQPIVKHVAQPVSKGFDHALGQTTKAFGDLGRHTTKAFGHIGHHTIGSAQQAMHGLMREMDRLREMLNAAKNFVDRFDVAGSIKIDPQALLNKLNLDGEFKKMIKNIGIEDLIDSLKQPIEGVKNEINKIPQSFEKIANEIGDMGKNLPKLLRLDKVGDGILKLLKQMFGTLMDAVSPFFKWIINVVIFMLKPFARIFLWLYKKLKVKTVFGSIYALMFMMIFLGLMSDIWSIYSILMRVVNNILPVMKI